MKNKMLTNSFSGQFKALCVSEGWKESKPTQYAIYFHCKTNLVDTFKDLYMDKFNFAGNRAIVFNENDEIPTEELKHCIMLSLTYHQRKYIPNLGV